MPLMCRWAVLGCALAVWACSENKPVVKEPERTVKVPSTGLGGPPDAPGKLPMRDVEANMGDVEAAIKVCADETTFEGKVSVRVTIRPTGEASAVLVQPSGDQTIDDCLPNAFAAASFPTSERGQRFVYSYRF